MYTSGELFQPEETGGIPLADVFSAYFDCRKRKRNTCNALAFESDYERNCVELWREINSGTYRPSRSIAFVVSKPVQREVFAADFRDRVVHHLIARRIEPLFEGKFIPDSYSTRKGKGTLYGIERIEEHLRACSEDYTKDCYIMKVDIRSFFMKLPKENLYRLVKELLEKRYEGNDLEILLFLLRRTIFNRPEKNCIRKTAVKSWRGLPQGKSLFHSDGSCGLPIGNLTSQLLALNYLDELDHLVTEEWGVPHYGRYVDDMVFIHPSKEHLLAVKSRVSEWLRLRDLTLHPRKMYLQHYRKGVLFIGSMILPGRKYLSRRTLGFCYDALQKLNRSARQTPSYVFHNGGHFVSVINSYLGMMGHFSAYNLRRKVMAGIAPEWWQVMYIEGHIEKAVLKKRYKPSERKIREVRKEIKELKKHHD